MEHKVNKKMKGRVGDSIAIVGNQFSLDTTFFFIDEFQVLDIADAMILKRLFEAFIETRMIVVFTSNRPPSDLYLNGLQRDLFLPFIDMLHTRADIVSLNSIDYRLLNTMGMDSFYSPFGPETVGKIQAVWDGLTGNSKGTFSQVEVAQGRTLPVRRQAKGVAEMSFTELCDEPRGSSDYMAIGREFNTLILRGVPQLNMARRDTLRRFILLIDTLYFQHRNVVIEAEVQLDQLFDMGHEVVEETDVLESINHNQEVYDEEFAYHRTVSRLREMQTKEY